MNALVTVLTAALMLGELPTAVGTLSREGEGKGEGDKIAQRPFNRPHPGPLPQGRGSAAAFNAVAATYCPSDLRLLDRHGEPIHTQRLDRTRRRLPWTPLADISPALMEAIRTSEDRRFSEHGGVDWRALAAAAWQRLRGGPPRGASTISMQLAALLDPTLRRAGARSRGEKWRQMRAAWALERTWTKDQILEAYLNLVTFRGEVQGVRAASEVLFAKAPHGLTQAEAAVLAALVRAPNAGRDALTRRAEHLFESSFPSSSVEGAASSAPASRGQQLGAAATKRRPPGRAARGEGTLSRAVALVIDAASSGPPRVALAPHAARRLLRAGCTDTGSTLDAATQRVTAESLRRNLLGLRDRAVRDAAVLVVDNASGEVLAYVAASGELSSARHVDGIQARRQAGSTLKPLLYGLALDGRVLTAATRLDDAPLEIPVATGLFRPRNYDRRFRGPVTVRSALAGSLNVPAVRALQLVGAAAFAAQLRALGFGGVDRPGDHYGPALALGAADVSLWELVNAYRTLANGGAWTPLSLASSGRRKAESGEAHSNPSAFRLPPSASQERRVFTSAAAFVVSDILADRDSRAVTFGLESPLATRFWSAVKTGTSKDMRDNWCIGFSRRYTVGVWVGNFNGAPMQDVSGVSGAAPIWAEVMGWLHRATASTAPAPPAGVTRIAGEWFVDGTTPAPSALAHAAAPRILAPVPGSIIALDPDIGADRQRVAFSAASGNGLRWRLGDADLGPADATLLWPPRRGVYTLSLLEPSGRAVATTSFEVRGDRPGT